MSDQVETLGRFKKRSFDPISNSYPLSSVLMTLLRLRADLESNRKLHRVIKRLVHLFCQHVEDGLQNSLLDECPCPDVRSRYHPFFRHSRRRGSNILKQHLSQRFLARGGGYVSTKNELSLSKLGIVADKSRFTNLASSEFVARQLMLATELMEEHFQTVQTSPHALKIINFTLDEACVCQQQVPWPKQFKLKHWLVMQFKDYSYANDKQ